MGKSGIIGRKIAATLSSNGYACVLHASGRGPPRRPRSSSTPADVVIVPVAERRNRRTGAGARVHPGRIGARLIAITGDMHSTLALAADVTLDCHVDEEACPLNLAPTASTTAALALGDALAMTLLARKGFRPDDFANLHPGGKLGKRLMRVERLMHGGDLHARRRPGDRDARRHLRDVAQGTGHGLRDGRRRDARRDHHRWRPASSHGRAARCPPPRRRPT